ncbi:MAG: hypothetical protein ACTSYR_03990 [Candidatus Odinarchaeia archaeon]
MDKEQQFDNAIYNLRRNYPAHPSSTLGNCSVNGCSNSARGGGLCSICCEEEIGEILNDTYLAQQIHEHTRLASASIRKALDIIKENHNKA